MSSINNSNNNNESIYGLGLIGISEIREEQELYRETSIVNVDKKNQKRKLLPHFKGLVKHIRGDNNTLEGALCDLIDNVDGKAASDNLSAIGCWVEMLYDDENGKIHQIKIVDNLISFNPFV